MNNPLDGDICTVAECNEYLEYLKANLVDNYAQFWDVSYDYEDYDHVIRRAVSDTLFLTDYADEVDECLDLEKFCDQLPGDGDTPIYSEDWFRENYANEALRDCIDDIPGWVAIDWAETTDNLSAGFFHITYNGQEYLVQD
jgi:hypothetical protein